ncbi:MAG TPA: ATP-dependent DNA helicase UvrD2 [Streptosporangiaceae bacterium]
MEPDAVLAGLDPEQRAAAEAVRGPVCILAGAGTGKTRAITHRIAYATLSGVTKPQGVLAVTFTTRAAGELRTRLRELGAPGVQARTFHAAALRQLSYFWPRVVGGGPPQVIDSKVALVAEAARGAGHALGRPELRDLAGEIEWSKVTQTRPSDYAAAVEKARRTPPMPASDVAAIYAAYEELRRDRNLLDFESMLELTAAMIIEHRDVAAAVRDQYRYFVVDEFQDVNPLQKLLLDAWLGDRDDLCVVGDPNQTIYSFTGATPQYLVNFPVEHAAATVVRLVRDYRSTPQVVALANGLVAGTSASRRRDHLDLVAQRPAGPAPAFTEHDDEPAEADAVAKRARELIDDGVPAREIAVLFRTNGQSEAYEQSFADAGVPYVVRGGERFFDRPEVRQATTLLRGAAKTAATDSPLVTEVRAILSGLGLTDTAPEGRGAARDRWESLAALSQLAEDVAADEPGATVGDFVDELDARASAQHAPPLEGVTLASLHAAKGLEWDAVFLVGLVEGMMPIVYAETPEQIEEERRLLYVGVTRARERLSLSWALARSPGGRRGRRRSRFLDGLTSRGGASTAAGTPAPSRPRPQVAGPQPCRVCGKPIMSAVERKLGRCSGCPAELDEALFDRLKAWRLEVSQAQSVPAYVIFTDATLQAIAEASPSAEPELRRIPGVGGVKIRRFGSAVLALCRGEDPPPSPGEEP